MADFTFTCPHCQTVLEAPAEMAGETIECPSCGKPFCIPGTVLAQTKTPQKKRVFLKSRPVSNVPPPASGTKQCPACGETILAVALKCKHCGEVLSVSAQKRESSVVTIQRTSKPLKAQKLMAIGAMCLGLLVAMAGEKSSVALAVGGILLVGGLVWLIVTRVRIWWHHA
jgi:DNA-directed RNA polymerase subunit M/transcription elongation factor TFIIS